MGRIVFIAIALLIGAGAFARFADQAVAVRSPADAKTDKTEKTTTAKGGMRSMVLSSNRQGHFEVDGTVEGRRVEFIVDTGASVVVLRESDAEKAGLRVSPRDYTATASTANGTVKAAAVRLNRVTVGDITVHDVTAMVLPDRSLSENLLGVSFLSRLRRYEYANGRMVLEQ